MVAKIAVSAAVFSIDKAYSYRIPATLQVLPGQRVMVPFGRGNRRTEGIVLSVEQGSEDNLKPIDKVLDAEPLLDANMLRLAAFMQGRYFCTFYDAIKAMLPAGLWFSAQETYRLNCEESLWREKLCGNEAALAVAQTLQEMGQATRQQLQKQFEDAALSDALHLLSKKGLLTADTDLNRKVDDKTEIVVTLASSVEDAMEYAARKEKSAPLQAEILRLICSVGSASAKEILYFTGASMPTLRRLEQLGFVSFSHREVLRRVQREEVVPAKEIVLTAAQQKIFDSLTVTLDSAEKKPALLYGVTGSGKTSVYIRLIQTCLQKGRTAILLVPEIALTPQLLGLMASHFGDDVAVLHSGLRVGERYDEWKRIRTGRARVVIGTRSAVFAPAPNLGLLILDEEQEHTYKSENTPRYHAREIAIWRGNRENALVLLGSATPSVESMYHGKNGDYDLYTLSERYNGKALPMVELADMRQEIKNGNGGVLSEMLLERLRQCRENGRQAILFLNRRGNSRFQVCVDCGEVPQCPRCSVGLTYHSANHRLMCHYCGHSQRAEEHCDQCGGHMKTVGAGTQKVEEELSGLLPDSAVLRMDADTVTAVNSHGAILKKFREEKVPILLGTQMVAKGLDFENVTLVGVLDADQSLYLDHFRAQETTFSMLTQVVGRAGRGSAEGSALIQTMTPEHKVIRFAAEQDYDGFYEMEIAIRQARNMPPFADLVQIHFSGNTEERVLQGAALFRRWMEESLRYPDYADLGATVLGPAPAPILKVNNAYRYRITVSGGRGAKLRVLTAHLLREFAKNQKTRGVSVHADLNPYE